MFRHIHQHYSDSPMYAGSDSGVNRTTMSRINYNNVTAEQSKRLKNRSQLSASRDSSLGEESIRSGKTHLPSLLYH